MKRSYCYSRIGIIIPGTVFDIILNEVAGEEIRLLSLVIIFDLSFAPLIFLLLRR